jgi:hypothetical protein
MFTATNVDYFGHEFTLEIWVVGIHGSNLLIDETEIFPMRFGGTLQHHV